MPTYFPRRPELGIYWGNLPHDNAWDGANRQLTRIQQNLHHMRFNLKPGQHFLRDPFLRTIVQNYLREAEIWRKAINTL